MLAPITHFQPITIIRRERTLPVPGRVIVRAEQKISASDPVAETSLNPEYYLLEISHNLGLSAEKADEYIVCQPGDQLVEGDIVAGPIGLGRRLVRCPRDGQVVVAGSGQVLIEVNKKPYQLKAGLSGKVVELVPDRGAIVETTGSLIQGAWGNGRIDFGVLVVLAKTKSMRFAMDQLDVSLRGSIVMAAHCQDVDVLKGAEQLPLRGVILASMPASLASVAERLRIPVILIEGFGHRPMNSIAYKLLTTNERREVAMNAEPWDRFTGKRPEVVISLPGSERLSSPLEVDSFTPGKQVRCVRFPYESRVGMISNLLGEVTLENGITTQGAEVELEDGDIAKIPLVNLEILM